MDVGSGPCLRPTLSGACFSLRTGVEEIVKIKSQDSGPSAYFEKRNILAIKLYKKLGYRTIWEDDTATTLLPTKDGRLSNGKTTIVCMKKNLGGGLFNMFGGR